MKNSKRVISAVLSAAVCFGTAGALAANGDIAGNIYTTDILTIVNGQPMESYNIGGKTLIIAEQLHEDYYGFAAVYDDEKRELCIASGYGVPVGGNNVQRGKVGEIAGTVYETDIKVFFNGKEIRGYNIGGKTAVCVEDLGVGDKDEFGYTKYLCTAAWDADSRTLVLDSVTWNQTSVILYGTHSMDYKMHDNVITANFDPMNIYSSGFSEGTQSAEFAAEKYKLHPLYLSINGEKTEVGLCFISNLYGDDMVQMHFDTEKTNALTAASRSKPLPYAEALELFENSGKYKIISRVENESYTSLIVDDGEYYDYYNVVLKKSGGYVNFGGGTYKDKTVTMEISDENVLEVTVSPWDAKYQSASWKHKLDETDFADKVN